MAQPEQGAIYLAGHTGMVGSAIRRILEDKGHANLLLASRPELDLRDQSAVYAYLERHRPSVMVVAAAVVGGIKANMDYPATFIADNMMIQTNLLEGARRVGMKKAVFIGSGCMYPPDAAIPTSEDELLTDSPEPSNQWYAVAKIAGVKMAEAYNLQHGMDCVTLVPCNLYGPGDNFDLESSHVVPAMLRKIHAGKESGSDEVELWGTGKPGREFLHVDDMARACVHAVEGNVPSGAVNVGTSVSTSTGELARLVQETVGFKGRIRWNGKLDGAERKMLDNSRIVASGWEHRISLEDGLRDTYEWMLANIERLREIKHEKRVNSTVSAT